MPKLVIKSGAAQIQEFELKPGPNYAGRDFANDLVINNPSVSSSHAQISLVGSKIIVKDLGSTNGTFINRAPITEAPLQVGQSLRFGTVEMFLEADVAATTAVAASAPAYTAAPAAPVKPVAAGLRISGLSRAQSPPPTLAPATVSATAVLEEGPADVSAELTTHANGQELVEAPPGKTACKFHPKQAGHWLCQKCSQLFCSVCVSPLRTETGTGYFCRICGTQCNPVKVNFVAAKEKGPKRYSDMAILLRALGFGFGGAVLGALLWTGFAALTGIDMPPIFCPGVGALCGFAVKLGCQDRPGMVFSLIAVVNCVLGSVMGKVGAILATHIAIFSISSLGYGVFGLALGGFLAWKFGGGDF